MLIGRLSGTTIDCVTCGAAGLSRAGGLVGGAFGAGVPAAVVGDAGAAAGGVVAVCLLAAGVPGDGLEGAAGLALRIAARISSGTPALWSRMSSAGFERSNRVGMEWICCRISPGGRLLLTIATIQSLVRTLP